MNRIEQVATPAPAQQPQPRLPRARRGTSGLAIAIAALTVPLIPGTALAATSFTGDGPVKTEAPHARHHLHHGQVLPGPGAVTVQAWTASGWTLTVPDRDGHDVPWLAEPALPIDHPRPVVLPDGTHGEIAAYRVSHASPRAEDPSGPAAQPQTQTPADPADSTGPDGSAALRGARSRVLPQPLIPFSAPANTKQMLAPSRQDVDIPGGVASPPPASERAVAADLPSSSCQRTGYPVSQDSSMVAHLRPAADDMDVDVSPHRTACTARVDYLSQARA